MTGPQGLNPTDLVIEAATERETVKSAIFEDLVPHLGPNTILTSNTSSISITRLASRTDRPEKFMGFHFMNPVPAMQLVEVVRGMDTTDATVAAVEAAARRIEHRIAGADANPYLSLAAILAGILHGIESRNEPEPPTKAKPGKPAATLPASWEAALAEFERSAFIRDALGADFQRAMVAIKRVEQEQFQARVSPLEYDTYLVLA